MRCIVLYLVKERWILGCITIPVNDIRNGQGNSQCLIVAEIYVLNKILTTLQTPLSFCRYFIYWRFPFHFRASHPDDNWQLLARCWRTYRIVLPTGPYLPHARQAFNTQFVWGQLLNRESLQPTLPTSNSLLTPNEQGIGWGEIVPIH